ncbi:DNA repair protein, partial [Psychrobacter sp. 16-Bac2893]
SQVNNNEMGVLIYRNEDAKLYADTYEEAQRIIRISDEVRMSLEKIIEPSNSVDNNLSSESASQVPTETNSAKPTEVATPNYSKLTTAKLAKELGFKTQELNDKLLTAGYLQEQEGELLLTDAGRAAGGTSKRGKFGEFCLWDSGMVI